MLGGLEARGAGRPGGRPGGGLEGGLGVQCSAVPCSVVLKGPLKGPFKGLLKGNCQQFSADFRFDPFRPILRPLGLDHPVSETHTEESAKKQQGRKTFWNSCFLLFSTTFFRLFRRPGVVEKLSNVLSRLQKFPSIFRMY